MINNTLTSLLIYFCIINISFTNDQIILWEFGLLLNQNDIKPINYEKNLSLHNDQNKALIANPFVAPVTTNIKHNNINNTSPQLTQIISKNNISKIQILLSSLSIQAKYQDIVSLIEKSSINHLNYKDIDEINYWLANAYYYLGSYYKAINVLSNNVYLNDRCLLLLATIYEAQNKTDKAYTIYLKIINEFPNGEYVASAKIKSRLLGQP